LIANYFLYPGGRYNYKEFYYTYDATSFFADLGGYLGLLLGHSMLSFYDMAKPIGMRVMGCRTK
jgi:hypothetical protein